MLNSRLLCKCKSVYSDKSFSDLLACCDVRLRQQEALVRTAK